MRKPSNAKKREVTTQARPDFSKAAEAAAAKRARSGPAQWCRNSNERKLINVGKSREPPTPRGRAGFSSATRGEERHRRDRETKNARERSATPSVDEN